MLKHLLLAATVALSVAAAPATTDETAEIDYEASLERGERASFTSSPAPGGANTLYFDQGGGIGGDESCSTSPDTYCEHVLVELTNPVPEDDADGVASGFLRMELETEAADYDLIAYESDTDGTIGTEVGRSTQFPLGDTGESISTVVTTTVDEPTVHVLLRIIFFAPVTPHTTTVSFN